jgi:hypothetical protein
MQKPVDWKGVLRELRLLLTQLQPSRFFALYALALMCVLVYVVERLGR